MAINTETKRASVLNAGSFFPGRIPYLTEPNGSNLDSKAERGTVLHHYAGIDAAGPAVGNRLLLIHPPGTDGGFTL